MRQYKVEEPALKIKLKPLTFFIIRSNIKMHCEECGQPITLKESKCTDVLCYECYKTKHLDIFTDEINEEDWHYM